MDGFRRIPPLSFSPTELMALVLSFGSGVKVLRPQKIQETVHEEAKRILAGASEPPRTTKILPHP